MKLKALRYSIQEETTVPPFSAITAVAVKHGRLVCFVYHETGAFVQATTLAPREALVLRAGMSVVLRPYGTAEVEFQPSGV